MAREEGEGESMRVSHFSPMCDPTELAGMQ